MWNFNILLENRVQITQKDFEKFTQIRRLSTESYVNSTNPLATEWIWYWKHEDGGWREYGQDDTVSKMEKFGVVFSDNNTSPESNPYPSVTIIRTRGWEGGNLRAAKIRRFIDSLWRTEPEQAPLCEFGENLWLFVGCWFCRQIQVSLLVGYYEPILQKDKSIMECGVGWG